MLEHRYRYAQYRASVAQGTDDDIQAFYGKGCLSPVFGSEAFKAEMAAEPWENVLPETLKRQLYEPVSAEIVVDTVAGLFNIEPNELIFGKPGQRNPARWMAMALCQQLGGLAQSEIAQVFHLGSVGGFRTRGVSWRKRCRTRMSLRIDGN